MGEGVSLFSPIRPKLVATLPQQRPLSDRKKTVRLIVLIHMSTNPENLVRVDPVNCEIIILQWDC